MKKKKKAETKLQQQGDSRGRLLRRHHARKQVTGVKQATTRPEAMKEKSRQNHVIDDNGTQKK
jgi:hypothetical protein